MKCTACHADIASNVKFCPQCGVAVSVPAPDTSANAAQPAISGKTGLIAGIAIAVAALAGAGGYVYYDKQQDKARIEAERVADEKRKADMTERDKKFAAERAAREREMGARKAAEQHARVLAQQKAEADARARAAVDQANKVNAAAAAAKAAPPPRPGAILTTERSAPLLRAMVTAGMVADEGDIQRYRRDIEALPKPPAGDPVAAGAARQAAAEAFKRGDTQGALNRYQLAIAIDPTDFGAYSGLAHVHSRLGRYADADAAISRALTLTPASSGAWSTFGMTIARSGNINNAAGALVNSYVFAADRQRAYESLQRLAANRDGNVSAAAARALQSRLVTSAR